MCLICLLRTAKSDYLEKQFWRKEKAYGFFQPNLILNAHARAFIHQLIWSAFMRLYPFMRKWYVQKNITSITTRRQQWYTALVLLNYNFLGAACGTSRPLLIVEQYPASVPASASSLLGMVFRYIPWFVSLQSNVNLFAV